jgi:hypothetical protein
MTARSISSPAINSELIGYVKWVIEKQDVDAASRLIPIVDRFTVVLIEAR